PEGRDRMRGQRGRGGQAARPGSGGRRHGSLQSLARRRTRPRGGAPGRPLMLSWLLVPLAKYVPAFNVFRYITFRAAMAAVSTVLTFPFLKRFLVDLGFLYVPFVALVLVGSSNAVNLTDGLDGLAIGAVGIAGGTYAILTYVSGNAVAARYLQIPLVPQSGEL